MHPFADLSAYLDDALQTEARASVEFHLSTCALCRSRLADLRASAHLIGSLPVSYPSRSLVPRVSVPFWVAPLRTLAAVASGAAIFLFVASAMLATFPVGLGVAPAAAPAAQRGGAGAASATANPRPELAPSAASDQRGSTSATPSPGANFAVAPGASPTPAPTGSVTVADGPKTRQDATATPPQPANERTALGYGTPDRPLLGPSPWLWLALAIGFGALALALGRRLRAP